MRMHSASIAVALLPATPALAQTGADSRGSPGLAAELDRALLSAGTPGGDSRARLLAADTGQ